MVLPDGKAHLRLVFNLRGREGRDFTAECSREDWKWDRSCTNGKVLAKYILVGKPSLMEKHEPCPRLAALEQDSKSCQMSRVGGPHMQVSDARIKLELHERPTNPELALLGTCQTKWHEASARERAISLTSRLAHLQKILGPDESALQP